VFQIACGKIILTSSSNTISVSQRKEIVSLEFKVVDNSVTLGLKLSFCAL
jgi:hypothetical protein